MRVFGYLGLAACLAAVPVRAEDTNLSRQIEIMQTQMRQMREDFQRVEQCQILRREGKGRGQRQRAQRRAPASPDRLDDQHHATLGERSGEVRRQDDVEFDGFAGFVGGGALEAADHGAIGLGRCRRLAGRCPGPGRLRVGRAAYPGRAEPDLLRPDPCGGRADRALMVQRRDDRRQHGQAIQDERWP